MQDVKDSILALQDASTTAGFDHVASGIEGRYPTGISKIVGDQLVEERVCSYLRSIHPTDWCVVGDMQPTAEEKQWLADSWDPLSSHGDTLPLFGVRTTSAAEGENNGLLWKGVRNKLVLGSMMTYCARALKVVQKRKEMLQGWVDADCDVTPHGMKLFNEEKLRVAQQTVVQGDSPLFYVFDAFDSRSKDDSAHLYEVNMELGSCTRCTVAEQMKIPCRHIQAVAYWRSRQIDSSLPRYDVKAFFHDAYLIPKMHAAFQSISIRLPIYDILERYAQVLPPPLYRQAGRALMQPKEAAYITRGKKRTKNRGECSKTSGGSARQEFTAATATGEEDETEEIAAFFEDQVRGPLKQKKGDYYCSRCSQPGHNIRSCTAPLGDVEEAGVGIVPGDYVVGDCPFSLLGMRAEYEREMHL